MATVWRLHAMLQARVFAQTHPLRTILAPMTWLAARRASSLLVRVTTAFVVATTVACTSVVFIDPNDDDDQGGSVVAPPSQGGASAGGGVSISGGAPSTGGAGGDGEGGSTGSVMPTNPDPACVPNLELPAGEPVVLGTGLQYPKYIALAGDHVYVAEFTEVDTPGSLTRVPKTGGELERVVTGLDRPWHITTDGESVYWTNSAFYGSVQRFSDTDGSTSVIQNLLEWPYDIAVYEGLVYATEASGIKVLPSQSSGTLETIPIALASALAVDETGIYAVVSDNANNTSAIVHIDNAGGVNELYNGDDVYGMITLRLDGNYLYLTSFTGLFRGTRDGGPLVQLAWLDSFSSSPDAVVADCFVYYSNQKGDVSRIPIQGGEEQVLAPTQGGVYGIAVDEQAIYWVSTGFQTAMRLDK